MEKINQLTPEQDALEHIVACRDKPFLGERFIDSFKGRGVFTHKAIKPSTFVVEYRGNIFSHTNTTPKQKCGDTLNDYLFEFSWKGAQWCVDASKEDRSLGRLVNDDHISPNCEMKKIVCEGKPHLCLFAVTEISPGEEITYNYGDSSYPWRSEASYDGSSTSYSHFYASSSTPRNERLEDLSASSSESSCSDDDKLSDSGPSHGNDSFPDINCQLDFRDSSPFADFDAPYTQQEEEPTSSSVELGRDEDHRPSKATPNPKDPSCVSKNYCYVCGKAVAKISRHLLGHADEEPDIAKALALPKTSKERKKLFDELRNRGNYLHNQEVLKNKCGELKLKRRPQTTVIGTKTHLHCLHCKGMFGRKEMWRHVARCLSKTTPNSPTATSGKTKVLSEIALAESPFSKKIPFDVKKILLSMKQDEVASAVQNDFVLLQLAAYLSEKFDYNPRKHDFIRQKLREMGRLLFALRERSIFSFEDAVKPQHFYKVVEAVRDITGFDENSQSYNKPTLALGLGHSLKKICSIVHAGADGNEQKMSDAKTFMKLCEKEWSELVSHTAHASLSRRKVTKPSTIPFTRDVQVLYKYLETTSASAIESLKMCENPQVYKALCRVTLAQTLVLSKCAPEVSKMTLKTFQERDDSTKVLSKHFIRINIQGRTGQNVAVLLTSELISAITLLVSKRSACGVHKDNPYLFAKPNSSPTSVFQGSYCIRTFATLCRAKNPEHFRSVHLHKHIARVVQVLNLENDELAHLAKLLGHNIRADRDYYRLPEAAVELAKISKLLLAMEKGSLERYKGNSLEEIEIEDELEPDVEKGNLETRDAEEDDEESDHLLQQSDDSEQEQLTPEQDALEHIKACRDKPFLEERFIDSFKGKGVFTRESIKPSTFVVEYRGNIFSTRETRKKKCVDTFNNYLFEFSWIGINWRIDATNEDGSLGRLVNDDHIRPNCEMKKIVYKRKPHLCLFAVTEISPGEEITFNYGKSSYPWRSGAEDSAGSYSSAASCCDEDYVPPTSDSNCLAESDSCQQQSSEQQPLDDCCIEEEDEADDSSDDNTSDEKPKDPSLTNRNYCYVCGAAQTKISRHLFTHRKEEPEIAAVLKLRVNSKERKSLLEKLRDRGNDKHNQEVLRTHCGELKVKRRIPQKPSNAKTFAPCLYCRGLFVRRDMWRHMQRCCAKKLTEPQSGRTHDLTLAAAAASTDAQNLSSDVRKMLSTLKKDEISSEVWNDSFLLQLAQSLYPKNEKKASTVEDIKMKLRQMGRLLLTLKKKSICSFEEAVKPQNFSKLLEAVRELTGFNEETKTYSRPSIMNRLGNSLKRIAAINFARAWQDDAEREAIEEAETFMKLCAKEWNSVSRSQSKEKNVPTIPFIQDVQLFCQYMEKTAASAVKSLTLYECSPVYTALLRVTIAQISVLNRNMVEVSKVMLKSFKQRDETETLEDAAVSQSQLEQILSKHMVKIDVMSNSGQKVAVTLTPEMLAAVTLLVNKREACGVHENNPFLFGKADAPCTSFFHGYKCAAAFAGRCGAKNASSLRSVFFHKHIARVFQILTLTNDDLDQLAKLLGRDIQTDREYYQKPEAAADIAKISELLSAMENGSLERFEGKSLEEIEVPDELEPDVEQDNADNSDAEEDNEELDGSSLLSSTPITKGSFLVTPRRTLPKKKRISSLVKRSQSRRKRQESEDEASELNDEKNEEANTENVDGSEEMPSSCALKTPEVTVSRSNEDTTNMCFSDGDDDMNVDFDMDSDGDSVRNEENDEDGDRTGSAATSWSPDATKQISDSSDPKKKNSSPNTTNSTFADLEETTDIDPANNVEKEDKEKGGELNEWMDGDSRTSSGFLSTGKDKLSAAMSRMKKVKILIPKLDIEKFKASVHISKSSSECNSVKSPVKDQPIHDNNDQRVTPSSSTDAKDKPNYAKATQMSCSRCKKSMLKGQTAYQKKGFTDVFCSKNCLFELFPINKPAAKTCHHCLKAISQPQDLIMAAVDIKGTMKDFCSLTCLISFKSNTASAQTPQQLCSMCNKSCTTICQLTLNEVVKTFCSNSCLDDFRRDDVAVCENCSSTCCDDLLKLKLEEGTKSICSQNCLDEFKEKTKTHQQCTMCHDSRPVADMVDFKISENVVELFCNRYCVTSYKLRPINENELQEKKSSSPLKKKQSIQILNAEELKTASENAPAESGTTSTLIIADSCVVCRKCGKKLQKGETLYQTQSSLEVFCSAKCLSESHPHSTLVTKKCYNCFQAIMRPHNMILAPVDDSGNMRELCSNTCLASVNSKRNIAAPKRPFPAEGFRSECKMCAKFSHCKFKLSLDGCSHRLCSDACFINYHRLNNLPVSTCSICGSVCGSTSLDKGFKLSVEDGSKTICSEECLVKFKEKVETPRLCPMCQTPHLLSDMVENKNDGDRLDFFCSNRCMLVHKAQASTVSGRNSPSQEENDIKEVKPSPQESDVKEVKPALPNLDCIKEEPIDDEYNLNLPSSISTEGIKDEPKAGVDVAKEDLMIGSVFSLTEGSSTPSPTTPTSTAPTSTAPSVARMDLPASCSNCRQVLMDGETVYQRKGHADIFCSTPCLLKFYQMKQVNKTCHFCLQGLKQPRDIFQASVDNEGTVKDFCSQTCLSSFNYKRIVSTKIPLAPVTSQSQCSMCCRYCISKHEVIEKDVVYKICSDPCFLRFCNMNNLSICENCRTRCNTPLVLKVEDGSKKLCSAECLAQFKQKNKTLQPCAMCRTSHLMADMVENKNSDNEVELFCTNSCVMASKIQAVSASGTPLDCDHCGKTTLPACHLAMSDASIRNFCTLTCAMSFKETQKETNAAANSTGGSDQTQFLKPPDKLPCAQCRRIIKSTPKVIQKKGKMNFVCSLACSEEFKTVNNIIGKCEFCKNERIIRDIKKVDGRDCYFCSDGCKMLFRHELEEQWGEHCGFCAYCFSISKTLVTTKYEGTDKEFCSEDCSSNYNMLLCHVAKCDTCGRSGKLRQSLPMLGEVKHFCDLRCLLHFCNKKVQMANTISSPPRSSGTVESSPVIANVVSLASALARQPRDSDSSTQHVPAVFVPDIQTKVVGHASIQTVPKELKNKSMLCTPLVHNKGVSCTTATVDAEAQTDGFAPKAVVLPVPVPVYIPLPLNMYSQYTPSPLGLPIPLPVPVFLPDPTVKSTKEGIQPDPPEGELESGMTAAEDERSEREDRVVTNEGQRQEIPSVNEVGVLPAPAPPALGMRGDPQSSSSPGPALPLLQQTVGKVHNKKKGRKLQHTSKPAEEETSQREKVPSKMHKLKSQCGIDAWRRWIQWKEAQTNLDIVSSRAVTLNEDVLRLSATELNDNLCGFIAEAKRPDGEPYSPDSLFYLCLSIQQYLFENNRMENIFSDLTYNKFSTKFTKILKGFKPSVTASGYIHSHVEEEILWDCKQLGAYSPIVLLNTLLFFACKYFGFTSVEQHRQLSFAHVTLCTKTNQSNTKTTFLRFYPPVSINEAESDADGVPAKKRKKNENKEAVLEMMENTENPLRCPVRLYEFYLSKCSESVRQRTDLFYLHPDRYCVPSSHLWFSSNPLDDGTMEAMLVRILALRELQGEDGTGTDQQASDDEDSE